LPSFHPSFTLTTNCAITGQTHDHQSEEGDSFKFRVGGSHVVQAVDRFLNVFGQHQTRYMFCSEHLESIHGVAKAGAMGSNKHVLGYLRGTVEYGLRYLEDDEMSDGIAGIYRLRLGRQCSRQEEHLKVLL
jgi:hypothetical protein